MNGSHFRHQVIRLNADRVIQPMYALLLAMFITLPLYVKKCFRSDRFYENYQLFWHCAAVIFQVLLSILTSITPSFLGLGAGFIYYGTFTIIVLTVTLLPAYYQHKYQNSLSEDDQTQ